MSKAPFDPATIRELATILAETGLTEIEIADKDHRVRVARAHPPAAAAAPVHAAVTLPPPAPGAAPAVLATVPATPADDASHPGAVTSPMVGVAYLSPEPGSPSFVAPGQPVAAGQTLLLIEAMKTFNQIKAPRAGTLARVLVTPGQAVEYGQVLMIVE